MLPLSQRQLEILQRMEVEVWGLRPDVPAAVARHQEAVTESEPSPTHSVPDAGPHPPQVTQATNQVTEFPLTAADWCAQSEVKEAYDWVFVCQTAMAPLALSSPSHKLYQAILFALGLEASEVCTLSTWPGVKDAAGKDNLDAALTRLTATHKPKVIVVLGEQCAGALLDSNPQQNTLRNVSHRYAECPVVVTHDLEELLRRAEYKADTWQDLNRARQLVEE